MGVEAPEARRVSARHLAGSCPVSTRTYCGWALPPTPSASSSMFMHCWRLRERVLDLFEKTTGGRVILSVVKVGGVVRDIDASQMAEIVSVLDGIKGEYTQIMNTLLTDTSVKNRTVGVGHITTEDAAALSMVVFRPRFQPALRRALLRARRLRRSGGLRTHHGHRGRLLRPREGALFGGAAVHRDHQGARREDPRRRHRGGGEGRAGRRRPGIQRAGAAPRRVLLLRARQWVEEPGAHAHAQRRPRRTSPA